MDVKEIRHVAELAELSLTEDEERRMADELGRIVAYVKELDAVDTTDVPPTAHMGALAAARSEEGWRADEHEPGLPHEEALEGAPKTEHGGFAVPTFVGS